MATIEEMQDMLKRAENVLEQAIELKEENRELRIKLAKYEDADIELDQNLKDFKFKLEKYGQLTDSAVVEEIVNKKDYANNN